MDCTYLFIYKMCEQNLDGKAITLGGKKIKKKICECQTFEELLFNRYFKSAFYSA